jgi:hypothetical protein
VADRSGLHIVSDCFWQPERRWTLRTRAAIRR